MGGSEITLKRSLREGSEIIKWVYEPIRGQEERGLK